MHVINGTRFLGYWPPLVFKKYIAFRKLGVFPFSYERVGRNLLAAVQHKKLFSISGYNVSIKNLYISIY